MNIEFNCKSCQIINKAVIYKLEHDLAHQKRMVFELACLLGEHGEQDGNVEAIVAWADEKASEDEARIKARAEKEEPKP